MPNRWLAACVILTLLVPLMVRAQPAAPADQASPRSVVSPSAASSSVAPPAATQPGADAQAIHDQLRALRDQMVNAVNKGDLDAILAHLEPDIVFTPQNAEPCRGREGVRAYFNKLMTGPNPIAARFRARVALDDLTTLYSGNNTAVAAGSSRDYFELTDGTMFDLQSRWTATVVRENGQWRLASYHTSANLFDNPILAMAKAWVLKAGVIGFILGMAVVAVLMRLCRRAPVAAKP